MQTGQDVAWLFVGNASLKLDVFLFILEFITCIITVKNAGKVCVDIGLRVVCILLCSQVSSDLDMYCVCMCVLAGLCMCLRCVPSLNTSW